MTISRAASRALLLVLLVAACLAVLLTAASPVPAHAADDSTLCVEPGGATIGGKDVMTPRVCIPWPGV